VGDVRIQLVNAVLVFVALTSESDANSNGDALDALGPKMFVQPSVDSHVVGSHLLLGEIADSLDCPGSAPLGANSENAFMHMNGVLAGDDFVDRTLSLLLRFLSGWRHLCYEMFLYLTKF